jgi:glycosyltransferase involved in cell wall biosynthesis
MTRVGVVLVTHNSQEWVETLLQSVGAQSRPADRIVVVDDASVDATRDALAAFSVEVVDATTKARDINERIAGNFVQGVRACDDCDLIALGDHDDVWHPERLARQSAILQAQPQALMVASDGLIVDADGSATGQTLRNAFPVPAEWFDWDNAERMRFVLKHSVATGGASMIRPAAFPDIDVPDAWLHDRWWSMVATARGGMIIDTEPVIDYRISTGQRVGLDTGGQARSGLSRGAVHARQSGRTARKLRDVFRTLRPWAIDAETAQSIRLKNVI